ncbi:RNA polymerase sigma factor SigJ [Gordonia sp. i37]|uniref:RNA polymerase sigma factor SigJ n=1 Tax=Gordonia sp. i37 TaxID=1961707 RepID=UPI0009AC320A|nr:RNA polymerase sigma factor SigJ [Gordonia sp. i37]OPX14877.1 RNA polymerase subunit sigma-24 [Gordonia sp. i37]
MSTGGTRDEHLRIFVDHRPLLFTIAYEILGSATESDDVLQESYLRWSEVDLDAVDDPRAYLAKVVTRQALNAARAGQRRREDYVGPWLPEPIVIDVRDPADDVVLAEAVSTAMMVVLHSLGPDERAVFLLREVFGFAHAEIADMTQKSVAAVRQIAHRAREHVQARRPRFGADADTGTQVAHAFLAAAATGDVQALLEVLAPDTVYLADSDGKAPAARRPIHGADQVARIMANLMRLAEKRQMQVGEMEVNGMPGFTVAVSDDPGAILWLDVVDGLIRHVFVMRNPAKMAAVRTVREISRH